jgi:Flp pilus assembly protein TadB
VNEHNPWVRFLALMVGTAVAFRLAWLLIRPVLPEVAVALAMAVIWQLWRWRQDRW